MVVSEGSLALVKLARARLASPANLSHSLRFSDTTQLGRGIGVYWMFLFPSVYTRARLVFARPTFPASGNVDALLTITAGSAPTFFFFLGDLLSKEAHSPLASKLRSWHGQLYCI